MDELYFALHRAMKEYNKTQTDLARILGMSRQNYSVRLHKGTFLWDEVITLFDSLGWTVQAIQRETGETIEFHPKKTVWDK